MNCRIQLSKQQKETLQKKQAQARREGNFIWFRRCTALILLGQGFYQSMVAEALGVCPRAVQNWLVLYLVNGIRGLVPKKSPGRPAKLSKAQRRELYEQIEAGPTECGYHGGVWTCALLQEHIRKTFGVFYSTKYISQLLHNMKLSHIKPKFCYALSREDLKKHLLWLRQRYPKLIEEVEASKGVLLFLDESSFQLQSNVLATWAPVGHPPTCERNPRRGSLRVLGCIELWTGTLTWTIVEGSLNHQVVLSFLKRIAERYARREIFVVMDNAPYHGKPTIKEWLEKTKRVHLEYLPKKAPHLNPIEKLWKEIKRNWTHNIYFASKEDLKKTVRKGLKYYQEEPQRVRSLMTKWEEVAQDPKGAAKGLYDPSLFPKKYHSLIHELHSEIQWEMKMAL